MSSTGSKRVLLLSPFMLMMGAFFMLPLLLIIGYSFMTPHDSGGVKMPLSIEGYLSIFYETDFDGQRVFDPSFLLVCWRSIKLAALCTLLCLLAGFPMAYYMATRPPAQRNFWMMLVTIPFWTNLLIRTYAWILILRDEGLINNGLTAAGIIDTPISMLYTDFSVGLGLLYSYLPFMVLPIYANLERMDWKLVEASADLYANRWQTLRRITIPLCMPGIIAGCILVFIPCIGSYLAPQMLGGATYMMLGTKIESLFGASKNWPFGAAASVFLMATVMIGLMIMSRRGGLKELV